jgi:7-keto-8-aminopelargonate synthetase-like enzyme
MRAVEPEPLQQIDRTYVRWRGMRLSYFGGCDYFRLSSHPKTRAALVTGLRKHGANVAASRLTTGNHVLYGEVEKALRRFFRVEAALVVSNGYTTNLMTAQALAGEFARAYIDARAHVSLRDASRFLNCPVTEFPHRDAEGLARAARKTKTGGRVILLTDGMFAHDGSVAPLARYAEILPKSALMLVDDAHGAGVLGVGGGGAAEVEGAPRERMIQTITLSKAFGAFGGAILGPRSLREKIMARSAMFAGSTPPPLPQMNAALETLRLLSDGTWRRRLEANTERVKNRLGVAGHEPTTRSSPIIPLIPKNGRHARAVRRTLLERQIFSTLIKYPGGPSDGYYRFVISSEHTTKQLDDLAAALADCYA